LTLLGAAVVLWTVVEIFQLFTHGSAFIVLDDIVPARIEIGTEGLFLPREILIYGLPIWAFSVTSKIGVQIVPKQLGQLMGDPDQVKAGRVMEAMLKMRKIVVADLQMAYDGK
jgi:hypothetical protein